MPILQLCANLLIPNCLRSNLSYSPLAALELYVKIAKASDLSAEVYQQMSDNAISFAHKDMSKESYYKRLLPFYEQLLNNKK